MRTRPWVGMIVGGALVAATLTACAGGGETSGAGSFTYWSMWTEGEPQQVVLSAAIDEFTAETGISVDVQWTGREVLQKVIPRLNAGGVPDLVDQEGTALVGQLVPVNGLLGLESLYGEKVDGEDVTIGEVIDPSLVARYITADGEPAMVPYEIIGSAMWYNGLSHPDLDRDAMGTWDGFVAELDRLKGEGRFPLALDGDEAYYCAYWLSWSMIRHSGVGSVASAVADSTGETWATADMAAAVDDLLQLIDAGYLPSDFNATRWPTQQTGWAKGLTDYFLMGTWAPSETAGALEAEGIDVATTIEYRSLPYPMVDGGAGNAGVEADVIGFAIPATARNADLASQFIAYFLNTDRLSLIATDTKNMTSRLDIAPPVELADYYSDLTADGAEFALAMDGVGLESSQFMNDVWMPFAYDLFAGTYASGDAFVAALAKRSAEFHVNAG